MVELACGNASHRAQYRGKLGRGKSRKPLVECPVRMMRGQTESLQTQRKPFTLIRERSARAADVPRLADQRPKSLIGRRCRVQ